MTSFIFSHSITTTDWFKTKERISALIKFCIGRLIEFLFEAGSFAGAAA
jgi:hypothetical protein